MIGSWALGGHISEREFSMCLEHLRQDGYEQVTMFIEHGPAINPEYKVHQMYWLVCRDPDGEWYWLSDPHDTGWLTPDLRKVSDLNIQGKNITLMVGH